MNRCNCFSKSIFKCQFSKKWYTYPHICERVWKRIHNNDDGDNDDDEYGGSGGDGGNTQTISPINRIQCAEVLITQIIH